MGLISGVVSIFDIIIDEAEKEWLDEGKYKEMLNELYEKLENGEIEENEYEEIEREVLNRLRFIRNYKHENGIVED